MLDKKNSETETDYFYRLLSEIEQGVPCTTQLHPFVTTPIEARPLVHNPSHHIIFKDEWVVEDKGGIKFVHQKKLELQKQVISFILKRIGSNLISGKSILNISLPIYIFEKKSNLEKFAYMLTYAPKFLEQAANLVDPLEQLKLVLCFQLSSGLLYIGMDKPFNPILGETYQGRIYGCPIYLEQISHHPPIGSIYMVGRGYK